LTLGIGKIVRFLGFVLFVRVPPRYNLEAVSSWMQIATITWLSFTLMAIFVHRVFSFATQPVEIFFASAQYGCPECSAREWRVTASRVVSEGSYTYTNIPACRQPTTLFGELEKWAVVTILAPSKLFFGSVIPLFDLDVVRSILGHFTDGGWIGKMLNQKGSATAECAVLFIITPHDFQPTPGKPIKIEVRSTKVEYSGLPQDQRLPPGPGPWANCPVDGRDQDCDAQFSRLDYVPTTEYVESHTVYQTRYKNWYYDATGFLAANPREVRMTMYFEADPNWSTPAERKALKQVAKRLHQLQGEQDFSTRFHFPG